MSRRVLDAVVVGAGHAGLAVSQRLATSGIEHVVLERGEIGDTWRTQRWDTFALNTPNRLNRMPGSDYEGSAPDAFATTADWVASLERYVRRHDLPVLTHTAVTSVTADGHGGFKVATADALFRARNVVVASGIANVPKIPASVRELDRSIRILTTATYRRPDQLVPGGALVVGGAQSAVQIAEDLLEAGREVYLAASKVGRAPRRLRGADTLGWLSEFGWFDQRPQDLPDPAMVRWPNPQISGTGPLGHTVSYQSLAARGATLVGHLESGSGTKIRFADDLADHVRFADERSALMRKDVDQQIAQRGIDAPPSDPDPADAPAGDPWRYEGPTELDLRDRGIGTVIFSTGFSGDFSWLRVPVLDERGAPVHVDGRAKVDGIWFTGFPWLRTRASATIVGAPGDSEYVVGEVSARLAGKIVPA